VLAKASEAATIAGFTNMGTTASVTARTHLCYNLHNRTRKMKTMSSTIFTVRVEPEVKKRLEKLAKSTGRTRSFLAADALNEYLDVSEWQIGGIKRAVASLNRGEGVTHKEVKDWIGSWDRKRERPVPKRSTT